MANPFFNAKYYLANNPDVKDSGLDPEAHYLQFGAKEGRAPTDWFNGAYYLSQYPDLEKGGITIETAFAHFQAFGANEGRNPSPSISLTTASLSAYAAANADLAKAFGITDPAYLTGQQKADLANHYYQFGRGEGRPADPAVAPVGETFTLTTGTDNIVGTAGNDSVVGIADGVAASAVAGNTFGGLDAIDGGAGVDTMTLTNADGTMTLSTSATVKNVENLVLRSAQNAVTADVQAWAGLQDVKVEQLGTKAAIDIDTKANATAVSVTGGTTVDIDDNGTGTTKDTLASVSLNGNTGAATIDSDALTKLSIANSDQDVTVTAAAATRTLDVTVNKLTAGTIADAQATAVKVTATGDNSVLTALNVANAATIEFAGDKTVSTGLTAQKAGLAISSSNTAGVTITTALNTDVAFTGGAGKDTITVGASTKAIAMGAGDDSVTWTVAALGTGGTVDGGDGIDTLSLTAANAATATSNATLGAAFQASISNFEKLSLADTAGAAIVDAKYIDGITHIISAGTTGGALTINNVAANSTVELTGANGTNLNTVTVNLADSTGTSDVVNLVLKSAADDAFGTIAAAGVETLKITSTDTNTTVAGTTDNSVTVVDAAAQSIIVTGNAHLTLTQVSTALTSVDASGMTVTAAATGANTAGLSFTTAALANAATLTGSAGVDVINASAATKAVTLDGGLGGKAGSLGDTLTGGAGDDTISSSGLGNHVLAGGAGKDTITGASGNDTITGGAGADTLKGNGGNDIFAFNAVSDSAPSAFDTIVDFVAKTATAAGDVLQFSAGGIGAAGSVLNHVFVANNGTLALAALSSTDFGANKVNFALDSSTGTLYVDSTSGTSGTSDGIADMAIVLTGVTTIDASAISFVA